MVIQVTFNILICLSADGASPPSSSFFACFVSLPLFLVAESAGIHPKVESPKAALPPVVPISAQSIAIPHLALFALISRLEIFRGSLLKPGQYLICIICSKRLRSSGEKAH